MTIPYDANFSDKIDSGETNWLSIAHANTNTCKEIFQIIKKNFMPAIWSCPPKIISKIDA